MPRIFACCEGQVKGINTVGEISKFDNADHSFYDSKKFLEFNRRTSEKSLKVHVDWL